jgi:hypothetical protein
MTVNYPLQTIAPRIALLYRNIFPSLATFLANKKIVIIYFTPYHPPFLSINFLPVVKICWVGIILNRNDCCETVRIKLQSLMVLHMANYVSSEPSASPSTLTSVNIRFYTVM